MKKVISIFVGLLTFNAHIGQEVIFDDEDITITQYNYDSRKAKCEEYIQFVSEDGYVTKDVYNRKESKLYSYDLDHVRTETEVHQTKGSVPKGFWIHEYYTIGSKRYALATSKDSEAKANAYHILMRNDSNQQYELFKEDVSVINGESYFSDISRSVPQISVSQDESKILVSHLLKHDDGVVRFRHTILDGQHSVISQEDLRFWGNKGQFYPLGVAWKDGRSILKHVDVFHIVNSGTVFTVGRRNLMNIFESMQLCKIDGAEFEVSTPYVERSQNTVVHGIVDSGSGTFITGIADMGGRKWSPFFIELEGTRMSEPILIEYDNQVMGDNMNFAQAKIDKIDNAGKNVSMFPMHAKYISKEENGEYFIVHEIDYFAAEKNHSMGLTFTRISSSGEVLNSETIKKWQQGWQGWQGAWIIEKDDKIIVLYNDHKKNADNDFSLDRAVLFERPHAAVVKATVDKKSCEIMRHEMMWYSKDSERVPLKPGVGYLYEWGENKILTILHGDDEIATIEIELH